MIRKFVLLPLLIPAAYSQRQTADEVKFSTNGAGIAIHAESSGQRSPLSTSGSGVYSGDLGTYRIVLDRDDKALFAYVLELRKGPQNTVRVTIGPADQAKLRAMDWMKGKIVRDVPTIAATREFPPLRMGDEVHVEILYNPSTGEKLWDVLRVTPEAQPAPKPGKVFTGPQFSWEAVRVAVGGKTVYTSRSWMIGEAIMIRVPGRGEYYLALQPPSGFPFQASGWVDHNVLRFLADGEQIEITGRSNLLMKSDTGTVWVYHVPETHARSRTNTVDITCSGDLDLLMHPGRQRED